MRPHGKSDWEPGTSILSVWVHLRNFLLAVSTSLFLVQFANAGIRMDGSEFQGASLVTSTSSTNKSLAKGPARAAAPYRIVATFGQPLMGAGSMTPPTANGVAYKFGLGYEYNVLKTSYDYECNCICGADPACDGIWDVRDVVTVVEVAYRGMPMLKSGNCTYADSDVNCDGGVNALDVVLMIDVVFRGSPADDIFCDPCK